MNLLYKYHRRAGLLQKSRKTILYQYYINRYVSIMKSYKFLNKCLKDRKDENKKKRHPKLKAKKAKQNYCVSLLQKMQKKLWQTKQKNGSGNKKILENDEVFFSGQNNF